MTRVNQPEPNAQTHYVPLYVVRPLRTPFGALGLLTRSWPGDFELFLLKSGEPSDIDEAAEPILTSPTEPSNKEMFEVLQAAWEKIPPSERPPGLSLGNLWKKGLF